MGYKLILQPQAEQDLNTHIKAGNKILLKRIYKLFEVLEQDPYFGIAKPHRLKHYESEVWSRRIDDRHRMVYKIEDNVVTVFVISLWGHYGDK